MGDDSNQLLLKRTDGRVLSIPREEVIRTSKALSMMPKGTLNVLSLNEIGDLFAYLESGGE